MILSFIDDKNSHFLSSMHDNFCKNAYREGGVGVVTAIFLVEGFVGILEYIYCGLRGLMEVLRRRNGHF